MERAEILRLLESGEDLSRLAARAQSSESQELLRFCSLPHFFDQRLFDEVLAPRLNGTPRSFEDVRSHPWAEAVADRPGFLRVHDAHRAQQIADLLPGRASAQARPPDLPADLRSLVHALAQHSAERGWKAEQLYHFLVADPSGAEELFNDLYRKADESFDAAQCRYLLQTLGERRPWLSLAMEALRQDREKYLQARCYWADAYYQTSWLYQRALMEETFQELVDDDQRWMLRIQAKGGMGKTMFLRWLIARRCAPDPPRIPCARIDFDFLKTAELQKPWQFLLRFAEQLDLQLPGAPLRDLFQDFAEHESIELGDAQGSGAAATPFSEAQIESQSRDLPSRFAAALRESRTGPVLLIFDTLEEAFLRHQTDVMGVLRVIADVQKEFSGLRLLLAGRFPLEERLPEFAVELGSCSKPLAIPPFTREEARHYLIEVRGLKPGEVVEAIVGDEADEPAGAAVSLRTPLKLSLFADVVQMKGELNAQQIQAFRKDADLLYLIKRVVARIEDPPVRWVLRYGVVPRRLSREFVADVMAGPLLRAMSGQGSAEDDPPSNLPPDAESARLFPTNLLSPGQAVDPTGLWERLCRFAGSFSWVSYDDRQPDLLVFHGEVVNPMRRLLEPHPVFRSLHRRAFEHYDAKARAAAKAGGLAWTWPLREAIYHAFQGGLEGEADWRQAVEQARRAGRPQDLHALAVEILGAEYLLDGESLPRASGEPIVPSDLLFAAQLRRLRASFELCQILPEGERELWRIETQRALTEIDTLRGRRRWAGQPAADAALAQALLLHREERDLQALRVLRHAAAQSDFDGADQLVLQLATAWILEESGSPNAAVHYEAALGLLTQARRQAPQGAAALREKLAVRAAAAGRWDQALATFDAAIQAVRRTSREAAVPLALRQADLYVQAGQPSRAVNLLRGLCSAPSTPLSAVTECRRLAVEARARLALLDPVAALTGCRRALAGLETAGPLSLSAGETERDPLVARAEALETGGLALIALLQVDAALDQFDEARALWGKAGQVEGSGRCLARKLEVHLRLAGRLRPVAHLVDEAQKASLPPDSPEWVDLQLLQAEWHHRMGRRAEAGQILAALGNTLWPAPVAVRILITRLSLGDGTPYAAILRDLLAELETIHPVPARLVLLAPLRAAAAFPDVPRRLIRRFESLLRDLPPHPELLRADSLPLELVAADLLRVLGQTKAAHQRLLATERRLQRSDPAFLRYELLALNERLGALLPERARNRLEAVLPLEEPYTLLAASRFLQEAHTLLSQGDLDGAESRVRAAQTWFGTAFHLPTRWHVESRLLLAEVADRRGEMDGWRQGLHGALAAAEELGDEVRSAVLRESLGEAEPSASGPWTVRAVTLRFPDSTLERIAGPASLDLGLPPQLVEDLKEDLQEGRRGHAVPFRLLKRFAAHWSLTTHDLGCLFLDTPPTQRLLRWSREEKTPLDFRVEIGTPILDSLPWELLQLPGEAPGTLLCLAPRVGALYRTLPAEEVARAHQRWVQSALTRLGITSLQADGLSGPATAEGVRQLQRDERLTVDGLAGPQTTDRLLRRLLLEESRQGRPRVLVLQASLQRQEALERGMDLFASGAPALLGIYGDAGFEVRLLEDPEPAAVRDCLLESRYDVLHICASLRESPSLGGSVLDFGSVLQGAKGSELFSTASLARILGSPAALLRPVVVLDVPRPRGMTECLRQLCLRNAFAADLLRQRYAPAIVATGLADPLQQQVLQSALAEAFAAGRSLDEVCGAVRKRLLGDRGWHPEFHPMDALPLGTALFTFDPRAVRVAAPRQG